MHDVAIAKLSECLKMSVGSATLISGNIVHCKRDMASALLTCTHQVCIHHPMCMESIS